MPRDPAAPTASSLPRQGRAWRSLFLSDLHLGTSRGRPDRVVDFLTHARTEHLMLVGDIFDGWNPRARRGGPLPDHRALLTMLERMAADGTAITLVPGNHDAAFRPLSGSTLGPMQVAEETRHTFQDGRTFLVTHGDHADPLMAAGALVAWAGGKADILIRRASGGLNALRERCGGEASRRVEDWLMAFNHALHPRATYAERLTTRARHLGFQGVICGHYHIPALTDVGGITYGNCGDWLDHFTALAETSEGALSLVAWPAPAALPQRRPRRLPQGSLPAA